MTNGGTGPLKGSLLLSTSGRGLLPPSLVLVNPHPPYNATVLLDNYYGRQFNSLNDVKVHPGSGKIFVVDVGCVSCNYSALYHMVLIYVYACCWMYSYGYANHFRPIPLMPNQVYRFDQDTGSVRVIADGFNRCNGLAFTGDGKTAYVSVAVIRHNYWHSDVNVVLLNSIAQTLGLQPAFWETTRLNRRQCRSPINVDSTFAWIF
jgi:gluconolactonase